MLNDISLDELATSGIKALLLDLDNTVAPWGQDDIPQAIYEWLTSAKMRRFKLCILSNSYTHRATKIANRLDAISIAPAFKPMPFAYLLAMYRLGANSSETIMIGDQLWTDIFGARLLGLRTIRVTPLSTKEFWITRLTRYLERLILR